MRGSIRRGGKGSWEIRIELEKVNGKRRSLSKHIKGSKQDAQKELIQASGRQWTPTRWRIRRG